MLQPGTLQLLEKYLYRTRMGDRTYIHRIPRISDLQEQPKGDVRAAAAACMEVMESEAPLPAAALEQPAPPELTPQKWQVSEKRIRAVKPGEHLTGEIDQYIGLKLIPGFNKLLLAMIDEAGEKDAQVYKRAGVDRRLFSKIRSEPAYRPSKATAIAFALALRLDRKRADKLIASAGYLLSESETFDLIIMFCIENEIYDLADVNEALVYFGQKAIGAAE